MLAEVLEARLAEWSRWCLSGRHHRGQCGSLEGDYRSPQHWEPVTWAPQMRPIAWRAYEVEVVVTAMLDPFRTVLTMVYIIRARPETIRRILRRRFRVNDHLQVLAEARQRVAVGLAGSARPRSQVPHTLPLGAAV